MQSLSTTGIWAADKTQVEYGLIINACYECLCNVGW